MMDCRLVADRTWSLFPGHIEPLPETWRDAAQLLERTQHWSESELLPDLNWLLPCLHSCHLLSTDPPCPVPIPRLPILCLPISRWNVGLVFIAGALLLAAGPPDVLPIGIFSDQDPGGAVPEGWEAISLAKVDKQTEYALVEGDSGTAVVRARSEGGAGALATERRIDLTEYPILEWRWQVEGTIEGGNARTEDGDDYPARIYVTFDYEDLGFGDRVRLTALRALGYDEIPTRALNYIWANQVAQGTVLENPYTDWVMMVAVRSGEENAGRWHRERRNVLRDYREAFGEDPPPVNGVAVMTDTDNTGGEATAYYGDILFRTGNGEKDERD